MLDVSQVPLVFGQHGSPPSEPTCGTQGPEPPGQLFVHAHESRLQSNPTLYVSSPQGRFKPSGKASVNKFSIKPNGLKSKILVHLKMYIPATRNLK